MGSPLFSNAEVYAKIGEIESDKLIILAENGITPEPTEEKIIIGNFEYNFDKTVYSYD